VYSTYSWGDWFLLLLLLLLALLLLLLCECKSPVEALDVGKHAPPVRVRHLDHVVNFEQR
jgi:hypothetical protein